MRVGSLTQSAAPPTAARGIFLACVTRTVSRTMDKPQKPEQRQADRLAQELAAAAREYASQADYLTRVSQDADARAEAVHAALRRAFAPAIRHQDLEVIHFDLITETDLAGILQKWPILLKPLLASCNIGGRAIERDLDLQNVNTYSLHLSTQHALRIAGYLKPFLPSTVPLLALVHIDRIAYIDKEIRAGKGRWEVQITLALARLSGREFRKRRFRRSNQWFEIDAAYTEDGEIRFAVDIKRIEARRDIHKRSDEIVNKARQLKSVWPRARFGVILYYPFVAQQDNLRDRLTDPAIDSVQFAGENSQSITQAVRLLLHEFGLSTME